MLCIPERRWLKEVKLKEKLKEKNVSEEINSRRQEKKIFLREDTNINQSKTKKEGWNKKATICKKSMKISTKKILNNLFNFWKMFCEKWTDYCVLTIKTRKKTKHLKRGGLIEWRRNKTMRKTNNKSFIKKVKQ